MKRSTGQSPEDIAQDAKNLANPALLAATADRAIVLEKGERMGWCDEWRREYAAAFNAWIVALHEAGDHRRCLPSKCAVMKRQIAPVEIES